MKEIIFEESGRKRKGIIVKCQQCDKEIPSRKDQVKKFCSKKCSQVGSRNRKSISCDWCSKKFERQISKIGKFNFCSKKCKDSAQSLDGLKELNLPHYGSDKRYRRNFSEDDLVCTRCGYCEFSCSVHIHHIDGDNSNNNIENLVPLCGNCHMGLHANKWDFKEVLGKLSG